MSTIATAQDSASSREVLAKACWARNQSLTYGGRCPLEIWHGRPVPDIPDIENLLPPQLAAPVGSDDRLDIVLRELALKTHQEARQRVDIRRDLAARLLHSDGPFHPGEGIWYWDRDMSKIRGGEWIKAKVISDHQTQGSGTTSQSDQDQEESRSLA